jgi:hypothetical protein
VYFVVKPDCVFQDERSGRILAVRCFGHKCLGRPIAASYIRRMVNVGSGCGVPEKVAGASSPLAMAIGGLRQRSGLNLPFSFLP